jgi:NACHT domain
VSLAFETGDEVDDIRCGLADDTALLLQAKRACGADAQLKATVTQWAGQVAHLRPGDRIGLATGEPKGVVRALGAALDRRRRPVPGPFTAREEKALAAVRARLPVGTPEDITERVLDAAIVMTVAVSGPGEEGFRSAANLVDGTVVRAGSGSKAVAALQHAFQQQAAAGTGSGLDEWLQILADAGVEVISDADGTDGPRRQAELDALAAYRARLASRDGVLEFSLLADDLPPMTYKPLADSLRLTVPVRNYNDRFLVVARRWPRMLLAGLPGMGKSTALEQAAARWAADSQAPVPVLVHLRDVAAREPRRGTDVTLPVLIEAVTATAPQQEQLPLRRALERAASAGEAVLLLDGLDECGELRGLVADGLAEVAAGLPPDTGVVLATRDSGLLLRPRPVSGAPLSGDRPPHGAGHGRARGLRRHCRLTARPYRYPGTTTGPPRPARSRPSRDDRADRPRDRPPALPASPARPHRALAGLETTPPGPRPLVPPLHPPCGQMEISLIR